MTHEENERIAEVFDRIQELPLEEQTSALDRECSAEPAVRREVLALLAAGREAESGAFLNRHAIEVAAEQISGFAENELPLRAGTVLGKYRIGKELGAGGMGVVYEAQDLHLMRRVALKVLSTGDHPRLLEEARMAARLSHPNIASIYDAGMEQGVPFIAMELVEGRTLRSLIEAEPARVDATRLLEVVGQAAAALSAAHAAGIVHRDIKPENIMIRADGLVKVLDFGLAAVKEPAAGGGLDLRTRPGHVAGTLQYLSPEQVVGRPADPRSDLFSLGVVAYELACGVRPFDGATDGAVFESILHKDPPPPSAVRPALGNQVDDLVMRLLDKDAELRFQTAADLRSSCRRRTISSSGSLAAPANLSQRPVSRKMSRWLVACAGIAMVAAATAILLPPGTRVLNISQITRDGLLKEYFVTDGLRLYYATGDLDSTSKAFQVSVKGGDPVAMPWLDGMFPFDISKDGSELLLGKPVKELHPEQLIYVGNVIGGAPRRVGALTGKDARFSPGGDEIVYCVSSSLRIARSDGTNARVLATFPGYVRRPTWSPDGHFIRVTAGEDSTPTLWEVGADGTNPHAVSFGRNAGVGTHEAAWPSHFEHGTWTPDGKFFLVSGSSPAHDIWAIPEHSSWWPFGSKPARLTNGPLFADHPQSAPDGRQILFRGRLDKAELVRYDAAANEWHPYLNGLPAMQVDYSRDGKWITYVSHRDHCVWRCAADGTGCTQLTVPPLFAINPNFSPDGSQILFFGAAPGEPTRLYIVPATGGALRQITHGEGGTHGDDGGSWSADGSALVFGAKSGDHLPNHPEAFLPLQILDVKTGRMTKLPGSEGLWSPRWSPDGRYIAAMDSRQSLLWLYDPLQHSKRQLTNIPGSWPQWSRDSKFLYFGNDGYWYRMSVGDGKLELVARRNKLKMADWTLGWAGVTPDGGLIATSDAGSIEIYALEWERR